MDESKIREGRAVFAAAVSNIEAAWIDVKEAAPHVRLRIEGNVTEKVAVLTPDQARRLAAHLYAIARRIDAKLEDQA